VGTGSIAAKAYRTPHLTIDDGCIENNKLFWDILESYGVNRTVCDIERHRGKKKKCSGSFAKY